MDILIKKGFNAKVACHFGNATRDHVPRIAQILQRKGKLVPNLIRDQLLLGMLQDKADLACGSSGIKVLLLRAIV